MAAAAAAAHERHTYAYARMGHAWQLRLKLHLLQPTPLDSHWRNMSAGHLLEEDVDSELILSKLQGRGTSFEHLNLSYLSLGDQVLSRVAAVMRQSSAFANLKQIWLGSNQLSSIGDLQLPSALKGIWLFSNRLDSIAALDVLLRLCRHCPEVQFVHMVCACGALGNCRITLLSRKTTLFRLKTWPRCLPPGATPTCPPSFYPPVAATA
jgi:hypothetical protein